MLRKYLNKVANLAEKFDSQVETLWDSRNKLFLPVFNKISNIHHSLSPLNWLGRGRNDDKSSPTDALETKTTIFIDRSEVNQIEKGNDKSETRSENDFQIKQKCDHAKEENIHIGNKECDDVWKEPEDDVLKEPEDDVWKEPKDDVWKEPEDEIEIRGRESGNTNLDATSAEDKITSKDGQFKDKNKVSHVLSLKCLFDEKFNSPIFKFTDINCVKASFKKRREKSADENLKCYLNKEDYLNDGDKTSDEIKVESGDENFDIEKNKLESSSSNLEETREELKFTTKDGQFKDKNKLSNVQSFMCLFEEKFNSPDINCVKASFQKGREKSADENLKCYLNKVDYLNDGDKTSDEIKVESGDENFDIEKNKLEISSSNLEVTREELKFTTKDGQFKDKNKLSNVQSLMCLFEEKFNSPDINCGKASFNKGLEKYADENLKCYPNKEDYLNDGYKRSVKIKVESGSENDDKPESCTNNLEATAAKVKSSAKEKNKLTHFQLLKSFFEEKSIMLSYKSPELNHDKISLSKGVEESVSATLMDVISLKNLPNNTQSICTYPIYGCTKQSFGKLSDDKLKEEIRRLASFVNYPVNSPKSSTLLAADGFVYKGGGSNGDASVFCFSCGAEKNNWQPADDITDIHRALSPHCPMVTKKNCANVPLSTNNDLDQYNQVIRAADSHVSTFVLEDTPDGISSDDSLAPNTSPQVGTISNNNTTNDVYLDLKDHPAVRANVDMGYPIEDVFEVARTILAINNSLSATAIFKQLEGLTINTNTVLKDGEMIETHVTLHHDIKCGTLFYEFENEAITVSGSSDESIVNIIQEFTPELESEPQRQNVAFSEIPSSHDVIMIHDDENQETVLGNDVEIQTPIDPFNFPVDIAIQEHASALGSADCDIIFSHLHCTNEERQRSFDRAPVNFSNSSDLTRAGFYFSDYLDCVRCFLCGRCLRSPSPGSDVTSPALHYPHCLLPDLLREFSVINYSRGSEGPYFVGGSQARGETTELTPETTACKRCGSGHVCLQFLNQQGSAYIFHCIGCHHGFIQYQRYGQTYTWTTRMQ